MKKLKYLMKGNSALNKFMILSETEKKILESYKSVLDGLSEYLGAGYEFVLHSLEYLDTSAIKVINGHYTDRKEGAPITDLALSMLAKINQSRDFQGLTYFNYNSKGVLVRSTTIPIIGEKQRIIGLLCINFYMNTPFSAIIKKYLPSDSEKFISENFASNIDDLIISSIENAKRMVMDDISIPSVNQNKEIITILYNEGIFNLKDAVVRVSDCLGISKNTVYLHIRNLSDIKKADVPETGNE